jgi:hypothetical protein
LGKANYMKLNRFLIVSLAASSVITLGVMSALAQGITKCQDAEGNWHYGTFAADACIDAVVDQLNESGTKIGEDRPPPSEEEVRRNEELAKDAKLKADDASAQYKRDIEIVRIYGTEETIIATRDRKIASIDNNIDITRQIKQGTIKDINKLKKLKQTKKVKRQVEERELAVKSYDRVIRHNLTEREKLFGNYITILAEFRAAYGRIYGQ